MRDRRRTAESNVGAFMWPVIMAPEAVRNLSDAMLGPGEPGPEDDWKVPMGPIDQTEGQDDAVPGPMNSGREIGLVDRLTHRG